MITYRSNERNTLRAAYCGSVRIGYVESRERFTAAGWRWQLIMLQPDGGAYWGFVEDENAAKESLEKGFVHWLDCAGLQLLQQPRETTDDPRRTEPELRHAAQGDSGGDGKAAKPKRRGTEDGRVRAARNRTPANRVR